MNKDHYFIDPSYVCRTTCIKDNFWTENRIRNEPFNGSYAVMDAIAKIEKQRKDNPSRLLDIGCGLSTKISIFFPTYDVTGLDLQKAIEYSRKNNPRGKYFYCDFDDDEQITSISKKIRYFDTIICIDVIEHVLYPEKMLRLIRRHLCSKGFAYISTLERDLSRGLNSWKTGSPHPAHVREWNQKEFTQFLASENFIVHDVFLTQQHMNAKDELHRKLKVQTAICTLANEFV